ncbi:MAG: ferrous iron transporter B, partial [Deltaproteobacteria bacterium]|nr:ferrous iron transporter B [Deltaproteobacteria bacterium]
LSGVEYRIYHDKEMHAAVEKIEEKDEGTSRGVRWVFRIDGERIPAGGTELRVAVHDGYIIPFVSSLFEKIPWKTAQDIFVGKYGLFTVAITYSFAIIFPIVVFFFLIFSFLEDTGYLPRLALMTNRFFKFMGLNGKVVLPMLLGLGCDTMAVLTTRILHTKKERLIAVLLLTLAIPCSAQLGVITATASQHPKVLLVFAAVILISLLFVGYLAGKIVRGVSGEFIIELPPMRLPKFKNIAYKTLSRLEWYLKEAIPLFVLGTFLLYALDATGMLAVLEDMMSPVTSEFLGLPPETARGFILGFLRRDYGIVTAVHGVALSANQLLVVIATITLFIPCVAQF